MTVNKRFTFDIDNENEYDEEPYFCDGTDSFYVNNKDEMELFIKQVNELYEEYENLKFSIINSNVLNPYKKEIKRLKEQIKELVYINYKIREENEELNTIKQFVEDNKNLVDENRQLKQRINELELLNNGLNYALQNIRKIDVEIDVGELNE